MPVHAHTRTFRKGSLPFLAAAALIGASLASRSEAALPACLTGYSLYSNDQSVFRDRDSIASGKSGSNGYTELGLDGRSQGAIVSKGNILLRDRSKVFANVTAGGTVSLLTGAQVTGTIQQGAAVATCALPTESITVGTQDITVNVGATITLAPGSYRDVHVYAGGLLKFQTGTYRLKSLFTESDGKFEFNPATGNVDVLIGTFAGFGDRTQFNFTGTVYPEKVKIHSQQTASLSVGRDLTFRGTLLAPLAEVHAYPGATFRGSVYAKSLNFEPDVRVYNNPYAQPPVVAITGPANNTLTNLGTINVAWTVNGVAQTTQTTETLLVEGNNKVKRCSGGVCDSINVVRDQTPPVVAITSPANGLVTNQTSIAVAWKVDGVTQTTQTTQNLTVEGTNTITRTATDAAGNTGTATITVTRDTIAPAVAISSPANGLLTNQTSVPVAWTVDGVAQTTQTSQNLTVEGVNTITRTATDAAGNTGTASIAVTRDTQAPVVVITSPANGLLTNQTTVSVAWTIDGTVQTTQTSESLTVEGANTIARSVTDAAGNTGTASTTVTRDTQAPVVVITSPANELITNQTSITVAWTSDGTAQTTQTSETLSDEGPNTVTRTFTDAAGNTGTASITVTRDTQVPVVAISSPANGLITNQSSITVEWTIDDAAQTSQTSQSLTVEGANTITRTATDAAGNTGTASITVIRDTQVPTVAITSPADGYLTNQATIAVVWSVDGVNQTTQTSEDLAHEGPNTITRTYTDAAGNTGTASITITRDTQVPVVVISSPANGLLTNQAVVPVNWTVDGVTQSTQTSENLAVEGANTISRSATDAAGNLGTASVSVIRDTQPPIVAITSPVDGAVVSDSIVTVAWSVDGQAQTTGTSEVLTQGDNWIVRTSTDAAGNVGRDSVHVIYQGCLIVQNGTVQLNSPQSYGCIDVKNLGVLIARKKVTASSVLVEAGGKLFTDDTLQSGTVVVENNGLISHSALTEADTGKRVFLNANSIEIKTGGKIDASGKGYPVGAGPGGQRSTSYSKGGSHAGSGQYAAFPTYGNERAPTTAGSGGSTFNDPLNGGAGGGVVRLQAQSIILNGSIVADGAVNFYGCGAGGSVWLNAGALSGSGSISASGGIYANHGGGGRIAVYADSIASGLQRKVFAKGYGGGTIYLEDRRGYHEMRIDTGMIGGTTAVAAVLDDSLLSVRVSKNSKTAFPGDAYIKSFTGEDGSETRMSGKLRAHAVYQGGGILEVGDTCRVDTLLIEANSVFTNRPGAGDTVYKAYLVADYVHVAPGARIDASGKGYATGAGPGGQRSFNYFVGGSHASVGKSSAFQPYGNPYLPNQPGSGGANFNDTYSSAPGGGAVRMVTNTLVLDGAIRADGLNNFYGSGAGGSVWLNVNRLQGSGLISASGGVYNYHGGGGRIAVYADVISPAFRQAVFAKGNGGGTIYLEDLTGYRELRIDSGFGAITPFLSSLTDSGLILRLNTGSKTQFTGNTRVKDIAANGATDAWYPGQVRTRRLYHAGGTVEVGDTCRIDTVLLEGTSVLSHKASGPDTVRKGYFVSDYMHIATGAAVDASGKGYPTGAGPGGQRSTSYYVGGSHAGSGSSSMVPAYGNPYQPEQPGSGGANFNDTYSAAPGGGVIRLLINTLALDGVIRADGLNNFYGSGAGGSVWLSVHRVQGSGRISASGGIQNYNGGGGRIAVYADSLSPALREAVLAKGYGGGTLYLEDLTGYRELRVDSGYGGYTDFLSPLDDASIGLRLNSGSKARFLGDNRMKDIAWNGAADAVFPGKVRAAKWSQSGGIAEVNDTCRIDSVFLLGASTLTHRAGRQDTIAKVHLISDYVRVAAGSQIDVSRKGYPTGVGPNGTRSTNNFVGGSHGGLGKSATIPVYDDYTMPVLAGSGGAYVGYNEAEGGGVVRIEAHTVALDGAIKSNGNGGFYGGGAGGSVWLTATEVSGTGLIAANGGMGNYPGGGGRVAIHSCSVSQAILDSLSVSGFSRGSIHLPCSQFPIVKIESPLTGDLVDADSVRVDWRAEGHRMTVDTIAHLLPGPNKIIRSFTNLYGLVGSDSVQIRRKTHMDLLPASLKIHPGASATEKSGEIRIRNIGSIQVAQPFGIGIYQDVDRNGRFQSQLDTLVAGFRFTNPIAGGDSAAFSFNFASAADADTDYFLAKVDYQDEVEEDNESNNLVTTGTVDFLGIKFLEMSGVRYYDNSVITTTERACRIGYRIQGARYASYLLRHNGIPYQLPPLLDTAGMANAILLNGPNEYSIEAFDSSGNFVARSLPFRITGHNPNVGDLVVVLTWNTDGTDVDMSIPGPNNEENWYGNKVTSFGNLDYDDVDGYGPETFVQVANAPRGVYQIRANYYRGSATTEATLAVSYKDDVRVYKHTFTAGDANHRSGPYWMPTSLIIDSASARFNGVPYIDSVAPITINAGSHLVFHPGAHDPESEPLRYWLRYGPVGMTLDSLTGTVEWTPTTAQVGSQTFEVWAFDPYRVGGNRVFQINIVLGAQPPVFTSQPPTTGEIGAQYSYQATATDANYDPVSFSLLSGPPGLTITSAGLVNWIPLATQAGDANVTIQASDGNGGTANQSWTIRVRPDEVPPIVSLGFSRNPVRPGQSATVTVSATDNVGVTSMGLSLDGVPVALNAGAYSFTPADTGHYAFMAYARDFQGNIGYASGILRATYTAGNTAPQVSISHTPASPVAGQTVTFNVSAADSDGIDASRMWVAVDGQNLPVNNGQAQYQALRSGNFTALAVAYDLLGAVGSATDAFTVASPGGDNTPPEALITSPTEDSTIYGQADIIGTAFDANLAYYTLSYRDINSATWTEYFRSTTAVQSDKLGIVDATLLVNGDYSIRLDVFDRSGNSISRSVQVHVAGERKIGNFTLGFDDLTLPMAGLDLTVTRTYDSRIKTKGDFGIGWQVGMRSIGLHENRNQGADWSIERTPGQVPQYYFTEARSHTVSVTLPGGRKQEFIPEPHLLSPFDPTQGVMNYRAKAGTYSRLEALPSNDFIVMGGELYDPNGDFSEPLNPQSYRLTLLDGSYFIIDQNSGGVVEAGDANGNKVQWQGNAITHSSGKTINFTRDAQGRITGISDGTGRSVQYHYDALGNLGEVVDANGNPTIFKYGPDHYLTEIIDARGVRADRTEYDDEGRVVRQINAEGDTLKLTHDLDHSAETVEDFAGHLTTFTYDYRGNVLSKTDDAGNTWAYAYDSADNLVETLLPGGAQKSSTYDEKGNELTSTDELGHMTTRTYNAQGKMLTSTDPLGRTTRYAYDGTGNLTTETGPDNVVQSVRSYDAQGNVTSETDALGNVTTHTYNARGWLTATTDALGHVTSFGYDATGHVAAVVGARGDTSRSAYDANGNLVLTVNASGDTARKEYNAINKVTREVDARGSATYFRYNNLGDKVADSAADGSVTRRTYDALGNVATLTDPAGRVTAMEYDRENRLVRTVFNDGRFTRNVYDALGHRLRSVDANGHATEYEYDLAGRNTVVRDALGHETRYEYDAAGRKTAMVDALGHRTEYGYDAYDRLVLTRFADGTTKAMAYDDAGRKTGETDQAGNATAFEYDATGNLAAVVDALGHRTEYAYDANNNRISQKDANNHTTTLAYDALNRLVRRTYPNGDQERWTFDANGNTIGFVKGTDSTATQFDVLNREVFRAHFPSGHEVTTTYTLDGKRDSILDYRGLTRFLYDNRGRLAAEEHPNGEFIENTYDASGNRIQAATPFDTTRYTFDALNRMVSVIASSGTTVYRYNAVGNRDSVQNPNGTAIGYAYDPLNRLTQVRNWSGDSLLSRFTYTLNDAGIRTAVDEIAGGRVEYGYDELYRLTSETRTGGNAYSIAYTYDNVGNRLTQVKGGVTTTYTYNNRDQLESETSPAGTVSYGYDAAGRQTSKTDGSGTTNYTWVDNDRMASVAGAGVNVQYTYDSEGRRVKEAAGGQTKQYLIDRLLPYGQVVLETNGAGDLTVSYTFGLERLSQERNGVTSYYLADGQGSIRQLTDTFGQITDTWTYTAFGEQLARTGTTENDFKYVGEQLDANAQFYYLRARWMNPSVGGFVGVDPYEGDLQSPITLHRYLYAGASPIFHTDPTGENFLYNLAVGLYLRGTLIAMRIAPYIPLLGALRKDPAALTKLANAGGPTVRVLTNLASSPQANRALSVATNISPDELRAIAGNGEKVFEANIPQALLSRMLANQMVQQSITMMKDVVIQEYRFTAEGAKYILHLFTEVP